MQTISAILFWLLISFWSCGLFSLYNGYIFWAFLYSSGAVFCLIGYVWIIITQSPVRKNIATQSEED